MESFEGDFRADAFIIFPRFFSIDCDFVYRAADKVGVPVVRGNCIPRAKVTVEALEEEAHDERELVFWDGGEGRV